MAIDIVTVTDDAPQVLSTTTGSGQPRLFEGDGLYMYSLAGQLLISNDGALSFEDIMPADQSFVSAMCQTSKAQGSGITADFGYVTVISAQKAVAGVPRTIVLHSYKSEHANSWTTDATLATDFLASDAIADEVGLGALLMGNSRSTSTTKVLRNTQAPPFTTWTDSSSGLPLSGTGSRITDLDAPGL